MTTLRPTGWLGQRLRTRPDPRVLPWLVLLGGLLTTALFCNSERHYKQLEHERIERTLAADIIEVIEARLGTDIAMLDATVGLFNASERVTRDEFSRFARSLISHSPNLKGIQGVGFAAVVPGNDVRAFETEIRRDGQPDFRIRPPGPRPLTTAIVYLQPDDWRNQRAIGFDMHSETVRRSAMQLAASTGEPAPEQQVLKACLGCVRKYRS